MKGCTAITGLLGLALVGGAAAEDPAQAITAPMLENDIKVSETIGDRALTEDGTEFGTIHNFMISDDGLLDSVIVEGVSGEVYEFERTALRFYPASDMVIVARSEEDLANDSIDGQPMAARRGSVGAGTVIGLPVDLDGKQPYETVSDLLISPENHRLTAYELSSEDGERQLLPATWEFPTYRSGVVQLPLSVPALVEMDWASITNQASETEETG